MGRVKTIDDPNEYRRLRQLDYYQQNKEKILQKAKEKRITDNPTPKPRGRPRKIIEDQ